MDNKEFAKLLLCEASELLEGAQAEAYKARKAKEKADKDRIILDDPSNKRFVTTHDKHGNQQFHEPGDKAKHNYTGDVTDEGQRLYSIDDKDEEKNKKDHERANKVHDIVIGERRKREDAPNKIIATYRKLEAAHGKNVPGYDKLNAEYKKSKKNANNMYGNNYLYALDATNRHLRRHGKKAQNESIAILLTEAALLLNEFTEIREIKNPETLAKEKEKKELERRKSISSKLRALELDVASKSNNSANDILKTLTRTGHYGK